MRKHHFPISRKATVAAATTLMLSIIPTASPAIMADGSPVRNPVPAKGIWAEIPVLDSATGRGVPLVELETVNSLKFVTDNAGRVAFHEPGLMGRELFFWVRSHGYEVKKDGFGIAGARVTPKPGRTSVIKITRKNIA